MYSLIENVIEGDKDDLFSEDNDLFIKLHQLKIRIIMNIMKYHLLN